jgi:hypothetical protein
MPDSMKVLSIFLLMLFPFLVLAQGISMPFTEAATNGIVIDSLDAAYRPALHSDTSLAVFKGRESEFQQAYVSLLRDLNTHLKKNGFQWKKDVRCFNRIYLSSQGKIEYFLYHFRKEELESNEQKRFSTLVGTFIQSYQFPLTAKTPFAQCSPITYKAR